MICRIAYQIVYQTADRASEEKEYVDQYAARSVTIYLLYRKSRIKDSCIVLAIKLPSTVNIEPRL